MKIILVVGDKKGYRSQPVGSEERGVVSDSGNNPELKQLEERRGDPGLIAPPEVAEFYHKRLLFYRGLMLFILVVGVPMLAVPPLRQRFLGRIQVLREAASSSGQAAVVSRIGENPAPLPQEYVRQVQPVQQAPQIPGIVYPTNRTYSPAPAPPPPSQTRGAASRSRAEPKLIEEARTEQEPAQEADTQASAEPEFRKGRVEQQAYDVLLDTNASIAGLVRGSDPAMQFKDWAAAKIEEDLYYVRLTFSRKDGEAPFIWQVRLLSKQIAPLNFNARSLPSK